MEWLVKKSCCNKQDNRHVLMLCDAGGAIKMIAEVKSDFAVKVGDLLSPLQNALYGGFTLAFAECALLY